MKGSAIKSLLSFLFVPLWVISCTTRSVGVQKLDYEKYDKYILSKKSLFNERTDKKQYPARIAKKVQTRIGDTFEKYVTLEKVDSVNAPLALATGGVVTTIEYKDIVHRLFLRMMQNTFTETIEEASTHRYKC